MNIVPARKSKTVYADPETLDVVVKVTHPQFEKLQRLGGSRFVQAMLDQAIALQSRARGLETQPRESTR